MAATATTVFSGALVEAARSIRDGYALAAYDHRPSLPQDFAAPWARTEGFRLGYACFKREVARVLRPAAILEIGVGIGISALAFLDACPSARYLGVDDDSECGCDFPVRPSEFVCGLMREHGYRGDVIVADSQSLYTLQFTPDLVHVDGCHLRDATAHDVTLAWSVLPEHSGYILVDDARDSAVAAGTFDALAALQPGSVEWAYFDDTWTGNILISKELPRP